MPAYAFLTLSSVSDFSVTVVAAEGVGVTSAAAFPGAIIMTCYTHSRITHDLQYS